MANSIWMVVSTYPSETYEFVSWDDDIPNWMQSHKIHVPNHQPDNGFGIQVNVFKRMTWL